MSSAWLPGMPGFRPLVTSQMARHVGQRMKYQPGFFLRSLWVLRLLSAFKSCRPDLRGCTPSAVKLGGLSPHVMVECGSRHVATVTLEDFDS